MTGAATTSALIADDHPVVLDALRLMIEETGTDRIFVATDIVCAYRLFHKHRPPFAVTDLSFEDRDLSGLSLIRRMRALEPGVRILAFSMHDDPVVVAQALECGALGYALKDAPTAAVREAIETVRGGRSYLDHRLATKVAMLTVTGHRPPLGHLNARELQILSLLSRGKSYDAIASDLSVSRRTVISACSGLRRKLGVRNLAELIQVAVSRNSVSVPKASGGGAAPEHDAAMWIPAFRKHHATRIT